MKKGVTMDWIVSVSYDGGKKTIFRECPKCKDVRTVKPSQIYDWYCPNCGQKMKRPTIDIKDN